MPTKKELEQRIKELETNYTAEINIRKHFERLYKKANKNVEVKKDKFDKEHALLSVLYYDKRYGEPDENGKPISKTKAREYANEEGLERGYIPSKKSKRWLDNLKDGGKYFDDWPL